MGGGGGKRGMYARTISSIVVATRVHLFMTKGTPRYNATAKINETVRWRASCFVPDDAAFLSMLSTFQNCRRQNSPNGHALSLVGILMIRTDKLLALFLILSISLHGHMSFVFKKYIFHLFVC